MKILISVILIICLSSAAPFERRKVIFFGDSITQAGVKPGGYVLKIGDLAAADKLADRFQFEGSGIGGNKIYDLYLRIEEDVIDKSPAIVVIYVGVNDVWHKRTLGTGTDADKFEKFYLAVLKKLRDKNIAVIVCTPAAIGEKTQSGNELDAELNKYSDIIRNLAAKNSLRLVDLRKAFLDYDASNNPENKESGILTTDGVHLNEKGNQFVADQMWNVIKQI